MFVLFLGTLISLLMSFVLFTEGTRLIANLVTWGFCFSRIHVVFLFSLCFRVEKEKAGECNPELAQLESPVQARYSVPEHIGIGPLNQ